MSIFRKSALIVALTANAAIAGPFWFPLDGYYPYSSYLPITAAPDLDPADDVIKTRMGETGRKSNGYVYDSGVYGFKKDGGGDWYLASVPYDDQQGGSGKQYMWYDNHRGYDFAVPEGTGVYSVEGGSTCGYNASYGQLCIQHNVSGTIYRTYYTHMDGIPSQLQTEGYTVYRWYYLGYVSDVGVGDVHLHFATKKVHNPNTSYEYEETVDPYGQWENGVQVEPYLWD